MDAGWGDDEAVASVAGGAARADLRRLSACNSLGLSRETLNSSNSRAGRLKPPRCTSLPGCCRQGPRSCRLRGEQRDDRDRLRRLQRRCLVSWLAAALAQSERGVTLSRLASLLHSAAAGVGDSVTQWGVSCLRVGSVAILCPALCRVWRRSGGGTKATAGRTRGGSSRPAVLSAQSACIVKRKGSTMFALSTASGCYVLIC